DTVINEKSVGAAVPTVSISRPTTGTNVVDTLNIAWQADDADEGDQLLFTVQYSHDGGVKWHTLVVNYPSSPSKSYALTYDDLGGLPGSAPNAARIRVLASDGFHTGIATSGPFTVQNRKPEPAILQPANGQALAAGSAVPLQGQATDPEDGGLPAPALQWAIDGQPVGTGTAVDVAGLAPGAHTATLTATDSVSNSATVSTTFAVSPLGIPLVTTAPTLDGVCGDDSYAAGTVLQLAPYGDGSQGTVRLVRSTDDLYACFSGLPKGATDPGAFVGLRVDVNNSRDGQAQMDDYGFFVGEDGGVQTVAGDGAGGFAAAGPGGLAGQVSADTNSWRAELRIDQATLGGWGHLVGLAAGHYAVTTANDDYGWPYAAVNNGPVTWATTALGVQPTITALDPFTATVASSAFTMTVEGSSFISGTVVLWDSVALPTTFVDEQQLVADVGATQTGTAGVKSLTARPPDSFTSNALSFVVEAPDPVVTSLTPASLTAGSGATTITVNGNNFAADAQVLWNGAALTTQVVSANQLKVQLNADQLADGQTVGVAVRNGSPVEAISDAVVLEVLPQLEQRIYLPVVQR
ncbi:MAG: IPT/TIG domain-containing protein, partial [Caldilineaceae bacterium]|nr:IPT/TIG domain-containing protein [Caldilineaceae bacterium]